MTVGVFVWYVRHTFWQPFATARCHELAGLADDGADDVKVCFQLHRACLEGGGLRLAASRHCRPFGRLPCSRAGCLLLATMRSLAYFDGDALAHTE